MEPIILASQSPRRKQLLEWAEIPFDIVVSHAEESYPENITPSQIAEHIALNKALAVYHEGFSEKVILAADTIVVCNGEILGKPKSKAHAIETIQKLSGKTHEVITGVVMLHQGKRIVLHETTKVSFHELTADQIHFYVDRYEPYDKAGAYAIQEWIGVVGIREIQGDFYNVMGLPVSKVVQLLSKL